MEIICPCGKSIHFDLQLKLADERHLIVKHCQSTAKVNAFIVSIGKVLDNIFSDLKSGDDESKQLKRDLKIVSRTCFKISGYTVGHYNVYGLPQPQIRATYQRAQEVALHIEKELGHLEVQKRSHNQVLDSIV